MYILLLLLSTNNPVDYTARCRVVLHVIIHTIGTCTVNYLVQIIVDTMEKFSDMFYMNINMSTFRFVSMHVKL